MKKQISGGVVFSFISQAISIIVGLLYTPFMIRTLGSGEYGLYQLVLSIVNYLNLMNFGFNGAYIRYFSVAKTNKGKEEQEISNVNGMFLKVFSILAILCLIAGVILYFNIHILGDKITAADYEVAKVLLIMMVLNVAISFPNSLFVAYMSANERFIFQKVWNIILNVASPLLTIPLLIWGKGAIGVTAITLLITVIRFVINGWYCFKKLGMKINIKYFDKLIFKGLLGYTFFIFLSDLVDQLNLNVDKFLLGRIMGTVAVAIYSVAFNLKNYFTMASWIVPEMYIPEANRLAIEEKDDEKVTQIFIKTGRINNYIVLLVLSGFILLGRQFITLWVGAEYDIAYMSGIILMIAGYIPAVQTLGVNIQNAKNMHKMRSIVYFAVACLNVVFSIFLIQKWGVVGTCLGTLFAVILGHGIFMNIYYHKKIKLNILQFWKEMLKWLLPAAILAVIAWFILKNIVVNTWGTLILVAFIYTIIYCILVYFIGLNLQERQKLIAKIKGLLVKEK